MRKLLLQLLGPIIELQLDLDAQRLCRLLKSQGYKAYYRDDTVWVEIERK